MLNLASYGESLALLMRGFSERLEPAVRPVGSFIAVSSQWRRAGQCPPDLRLSW